MPRFPRLSLALVLAAAPACTYAYTVSATAMPGAPVGQPSPSGATPAVYLSPPTDRRYAQLETVFFQGHGSETWACTRHDIKDFFPDLEDAARKVGGDGIIVSAYDTYMNCVQNVTGTVIHLAPPAGSQPASSP